MFWEFIKFFVQKLNNEKFATFIICPMFHEKFNISRKWPIQTKNFSKFSKFLVYLKMLSKIQNSPIFVRNFIKNSKIYQKKKCSLNFFFAPHVIKYNWATPRIINPKCKITDFFFFP